MRSSRSLPMAAMAAALGFGAISASADSIQWATSAVGSNGNVEPYGNAADATGAPDGKFYSLGIGGSLTLNFVPPHYTDGGAVIEITWGNRNSWVELAYVQFIGTDNVAVPVPAVLIDNQVQTQYVSIPYSGAPIKSIVITDATGVAAAQTAFNATHLGAHQFGPLDDPNNPGFDIDAAGIVVPVPAAAWAGMALFGLIGVAKARRRQSAE